MFFRILRKDMKRKRTSNVIIMIFVIIATMFVSSSVHNIISVLSGIDGFFDKAGLDCDYIAIARINGEDDLSETLKNSECVTDFKEENMLICKNSDISGDNEESCKIGDNCFIMSIGNTKLNYFDKNNDRISDVREGEVYVHVNLMDKNDIKEGDILHVNMDGTQLDLKVAGALKDALLGTAFLQDYRFIISDADYQKLISSPETSEKRLCGAYYVYTDNMMDLKDQFTEIQGVMFDAPISTIRICYVMNMIVAAVFLIVSVGLILVSFAVLRFAIASTISEEIREIGVMKAVGVPDGAIRRIYIVKYFAIAIVGAVIGAVASVPLGSMLMNIISKEMVLDSGNALLTTVFCALGVVGVILLFCYSCTRKVRKLSPIDAVRSGQTGERFGKKSILSLGKSRLGTSGFLAANDCLSAPKQFGLIIAIITLCLLPVMILSNAFNTLCSEKLVHLFGTTISDVYIVDNNRTVDIMGGDDDADVAMTKEIEDILAENDMPGDCHVEMFYKYPIRFKDKKSVLSFLQCKETDTSDYEYTEGVPPANENEIALAHNGAKIVGAEIGDTVEIEIDGEYRPFLVTAYFSSLNHLGEVGRFHQDVHTSHKNRSFTMAFQVNFSDDPGENEISERIDRIKDIFGCDTVFDAAGYSKDCTGVADIVKVVKYLILLITFVVTVLIIVLMERSFVSKEKSEIALMKAVGFRNNTIIAKHTLRFVIASVIAAVLAALLCLLLTGPVIDPIFSIMGSSAHVEYVVEPLEVFVVYPLAVIVVTAVSAFVSSLSTVSITASQTADID